MDSCTKMSLLLALGLVASVSLLHFSKPQFAKLLIAMVMSSQHTALLGAVVHVMNFVVFGDPLGLYQEKG